jgi:hypothetical protein
VRVGIRTNDPDVLDLLLPCLPPGWRPARSPVVDHLYSVWSAARSSHRGVRHFHQLYVGPARLVRSLVFDEVVERLESHLDLVVAAEARDRVFVHAGVVGWQGKAILLPGNSYSGKSSLVAALARAGASYFSDDYAVLDAHGLAHPYPRPLSLRDEHGQRRRRIAEELGAPVAPGPVPVGLIVVTSYRPGARWRPRALSPGKALLALLASTVPARVHPHAVLGTLRRVAMQAPTLKTWRGEAREVVEPIRAALDG